MSENGQSTGSHTPPTVPPNDESTVRCSPQKRRRSSSSQQDSNVSPLAAAATDPVSIAAALESSNQAPLSEPNEQSPSTDILPFSLTPLMEEERARLRTEQRRAYCQTKKIVDPYRDDIWHGASLQQLDALIEHFTSDHYEGTTWESLDESTKKEFLSWAPDAPKICLMHKGSIYLFKSWIWRILDKSVLSGKCPELVDWTSPSFKAQNDMQNAVLECNPQASTQSETVACWNFWKFVSMKMVQEAMSNKRNPVDIDYRIEPASISKIITKGLGSNFPNELRNDDKKLLDQISMAVAKMEMVFNNTMAEILVVFHHPDNMRRSGFAFDPEADSCAGQVMSNVDDWGAHDEEYFAMNLARQYKSGSVGRPVDFIVSPLVTCRGFRDAFRTYGVLYPMTVAVDWVATWEKEVEEQRKEDEEKQREERGKQKEEEDEEGTRAKGKGKAGE